jgi:hypothetical protein
MTTLLTTDNLNKIFREIYDNADTAYEEAMKLESSKFIKIHCPDLRIITINESVIALVGSPGLLDSSMRETVTDVILSNNITEIPDRCFTNMPNLLTVSIPHSVTSIGERAFEGCSSLDELTIPVSVTTVGNNVFEGCPDLGLLFMSDELWNDGDPTFIDCSSGEPTVLLLSERIVDGDFSAVFR